MGGGKRFRITGEGYSPNGGLRGYGALRSADRSGRDAPLPRGIGRNDAKLEERSDEEGTRSWQIIGDPTEGAMVVAAAKSGYRRGDLEKTLPRIQEIPFDSERKRMTTIHSHDGGELQASASGFSYPPVFAFVKGAPDVILDLCGHAMASGQPVGLTGELARRSLEQNRDMASNALRVLAVAYARSRRPGSREPGNRREGSHLHRAPRDDRTRRAGGGRRDQGGQWGGLKSVMVTAITRTPPKHRQGHRLADPGGLVLTGPEIEKLSTRNCREDRQARRMCCASSPSIRRGSWTRSSARHVVR